MSHAEPYFNQKYLFSKYDPNWKRQFKLIKNYVRLVFDERALNIEHVGSTSIEGMKAKPIIDVLVVVNKIESFKKQKELMSKAGYKLAENYVAPNSLVFFKLNAGGQKTENIHVCEKDSPLINQFIAIRDYLRSNPGKAKAYSDLKERNAHLYSNNYSAYRAAKAPFLKILEKEAYQWFASGVDQL